MKKKKPRASCPTKRKRPFSRTGTFKVYILECADGTYYTGYTKNLPERLKLHNCGRGSKYVRGKRPVKLAYSRKYRYYKLAFAEERRIKRLSRRDKEKLVRSYRKHGG